jgi:hypothetical protein
VTTVDVSRPAPMSSDRALACFWRPATLRKFWPSVEVFQAGYDDGLHQDGLMVVERDGRQERIRVIRLRRGREIAFFTPQAPPMMSRHTGSWRFEDAPTGGCVVRAAREYQLRRGEGESTPEFSAREREFAGRLRQRLDALLQAFAAHAAASPESAG